MPLISGVIIVNSRIKPLSLQLANQIAAGEVVERPSSVVKELLENAIDADSSQIQIDIESGGIALVRIIDNGAGIDKDDLSLAVTRHATSKIATLSELEKILSLGFRGEALASISAVSRLSLKSRRADSECAWMINTGTDNDFANYNAQPEPTAHSQGSTIEVRDLFYNTPARRKFMRTAKTEFKHIDDVLKRIALSRFDIAFKLTHNNKLLRNLAQATTEKAITQRIKKLFSEDFIAHSNRFDFTSNHFSNMGGIRLWGWVSQPQWHRKQSDWQYFYVNGRYIKDKLVNHALRQVYQEYLPEDSFSAYLIYLEIDAEQVDVNVHPTKHEVRFRQARLVHDFVYSGLKDALFPQGESTHASPEIRDSQTEKSDKGQNYYHFAHRPAPTSAPADRHQVSEQLKSMGSLYSSHSNQAQIISPQISESPVSEAYSAKSVKPLADQHLFFGTSLGCLIPNYLISQSVNNGEDVKLFIIHIVRAQQFLVKQFLVKQFLVKQLSTDEKQLASKALLIPETIQLDGQSIEQILDHQIALKQWGLELSCLGEDSLLIRSIPSLTHIPGCHINLNTLIKKLLQVIKENKSLNEKDMMTALLNSIASSRLTLAEQALLLTLLAQHTQDKQLAKVKPAIWKTLDESTLSKLLD